MSFFQNKSTESLCFQSLFEVKKFQVFLCGRWRALHWKRHEHMRHNTDRISLFCVVKNLKHLKKENAKKRFSSSNNNERNTSIKQLIENVTCSAVCRLSCGIRTRDETKHRLSFCILRLCSLELLQRRRIQNSLWVFGSTQIKQRGCLVTSRVRIPHCPVC